MPASIISDNNITFRQVIKKVYNSTLTALRVSIAAGSALIGKVTVDSMPANVTTSGVLTAPTLGSVTITLPNGCGSVAAQVVGTYTGQLEFEGSVDGTNFVSVQASNGAATVNATAGVGVFLLPGAGFAKIRVRASVLSAGAVTITLIATIGTTASVQTGATPQGTNVIGKTGHDVTGIADNRKAVTTAGTAERLVAASTLAKYIFVTAFSTNTGRVMIGGSTVDETPASSRGIPLAASQTIGFPIDDVNDIFVDSAVNLEGVMFAYLT
jgi:hypothetical protein